MGNVNERTLCEPSPHSCGALLNEDVNVCRLFEDWIFFCFPGIFMTVSAFFQLLCSSTTNIDAHKIKGISSRKISIQDAFPKFANGKIPKLIESAKEQTLLAYWHSAAEQGHTEMISSIIQLKTDRKVCFNVDHLDTEGLSAMHKAARGGHLPLCKLLGKVWLERFDI
jgi:hypothetical protein